MTIFMTQRSGGKAEADSFRSLGGAVGGSAGSLNIDVKTQFGALAELFAQAVVMTPISVARALNNTNSKVNTQVGRAIARQTSLKVSRVQAALKRQYAGPRNLVAAIHARGSYIPLKNFAARETRKGVSAAVWGKRQVFTGTFMKGGRFPHRVALQLGGHVFARVSRDKKKIHVLWGPAIPVEMIKDASKAAFEQTVARELPNDLDRALGSVLRGF